MLRPIRLPVALILTSAGMTFALTLLLGATKARDGNDGLKSRESHAMKTGDGIISKPSKYTVPETLDRLEAVLGAKGIRVFARVDHRGEAEKVGMKMPPTQLLIFGNPKAGTPVMLAAPTAAIDLPLKALAWQDGDGNVWLSYNDPAYLKQRFGLTDTDVKGIAGAGNLIDEALK